MQIEDDILTLVGQGAYLDAARLLQSRRDITLDEAAAEIDRLRHEITPLDPDAAPGHPAADPITPAIAEAASSGRTIEAIKLYREVHGVGLKEAKNAVDEYLGSPRFVPRPARTPQIANPPRPGLLRRLFGD